MFDFSPFMVKVENNRMPFTHFLTKICAIVGGVISARPLTSKSVGYRFNERQTYSFIFCSSYGLQIAGFVDSFMYNSLHVRRRTTTGGGVSKYS